MKTIIKNIFLFKYKMNNKMIKIIKIKYLISKFNNSKMF